MRISLKSSELAKVAPLQSAVSTMAATSATSAIATVSTVVAANLVQYALTITHIAIAEPLARSAVSAHDASDTNAAASDFAWSFVAAT